TSGTFDPWTFNPLNVSMKFANPIDLGVQTFLDKQATIPLNVKTAYGTLAVNLAEEIKIQGDLMADAGVMLNWQNKRVECVPSGTYFSLGSVFTITPTVKVTTTTGWLMNTTSTGDMKLTFTLDGTTNYSGAVTGNPTQFSSNYLASLEGNFDFKIDG